MRHLPGAILRNPDNNFKTPTEVVRTYDTVGHIDAHHFVSWADVERDLTAWLGNRMQEASIRELYKLEGAVKASNDETLINAWRKLTTSDHYYYMCTKWFADGDVHKYFSPYESPYEAYIAFMNVLQDIKLRLAKHAEKMHGNELNDTHNRTNHENRNERTQKNEHRHDHHTRIEEAFSN